MKKIKIIKPIPGVTEDMIKSGENIFEIQIGNVHTHGKFELGIEFIKVFDKNNNPHYCTFSVSTLQLGGYAKYVPEKPKTVWDLKKGDVYWCIDISAELLVIGYDRIEDGWDERRLEAFIAVGLAFVTEEEAKKELTKRKAIFKIHEYCAEKGWDTTYLVGVRTYSIHMDKQGALSVCDINLSGNPIGCFTFDDALELGKAFPEELKIILQ